MEERKRVNGSCPRKGVGYVDGFGIGKGGGVQQAYQKWRPSQTKCYLPRGPAIGSEGGRR